VTSEGHLHGRLRGLSHAGRSCSPARGTWHARAQREMKEAPGFGAPYHWAAYTVAG